MYLSLSLFLCVDVYAGFSIGWICSWRRKPNARRLWKSDPVCRSSRNLRECEWMSSEKRDTETLQSLQVERIAIARWLASQKSPLDACWNAASRAKELIEM